MALLELLKSLRKITCYIVMVILLILMISNSNAADDDAGPRTSYPINTETISTTEPNQGTKYNCHVEPLDWNPIPFLNEDMDWELDNPSCIAYIATGYAANKAAGKISSWACGNAAENTLVEEAAAVGVVFSPAELKAIISNAKSCGILQGPTKIACCSSIVAKTAAFAAAVAELKLIWVAADQAHQTARICGRQWDTWENPLDKNGNPKSDVWTRSSENSPTINANYNVNYSNYTGSYSKYLKDKFKAGFIDTDIKNKEFRELVYNGVEYQTTEDTTQGGESKLCKNPWSHNTRMKILGYDDENQRYYMRGSGQQANYACERFLINSNEEERKAGISAYECCINKSQNNICIEADSGLGNGYEYKFCELGASRCLVAAVWYETYASKKTANMICAKTYSVCPFNHLLGGGTETLKEDASNNCQYLKHCVKIPQKPYFRDTRLRGAYISSSCFDLKGDSQNTYSFNNDLVTLNDTNSAHFSAPIAQCFHETLYNIFLYKAGHIQCNNSEEVPTKDGKCKGGVKFNIGDDIPEASFFEKIQSNLKIVIKLALTTAVMVMGYQILMSGQVIERKEMSLFVVKVALIMYFALGNAWQEKFFQGVFKVPTILSDIFINIQEDQTKILAISKDNPTKLTLENLAGRAVGDKIEIQGVPEIPELNNKIFAISDISFNQPENTIRLKTVSETNTGGVNIDGGNFATYQGKGGIPIEEKLDGCQFPKFNYSDSNETTRYSNAKYPPGKEYLKIWDTLDCKIARSLGMVPGSSVPTLLFVIAASFFTGGLGLLFSFAAIIFAFYLLSIAVRALHMFLLCTISIVLLIYVSPIMITLALFKKTAPIFKKWWTNLLGFTLQPIILFAYLGILITIFNKVVVGDLIYKGDGISGPKQAVCNTGPTIANAIEDLGNNAATQGDVVTDSPIVYTGAKDSIYCIFSELGIKSTTIEQLGIPIPSLTIFESGRINEILTTMIKAAFLMFIFSQFFGKISTLASVLVGGAAVSAFTGDVAGSITSAEGINVGKTAQKFGSAIKGFGDRGRRGGIKAGKAIASKGRDKAKSWSRKMGTEKSTKDN